MSGNDVLIYGGGISGMVAAVNLAREGFKVVVREKEGGFGGSRIFNPSVHTTPIDPEATSDYIGIDIAPAFRPVSKISLYLHDFAIEIPGHMTFHVERSSRGQSLDKLLFDECLKEGVDFEFGRSLETEEARSFPENTIIACGLNEPVYELLGMPKARWTAWMARGECSDESRDNSAWIWLDECVNEYGYISFCNGIYYNLLFASRETVTREALEKYRGFMRRVESFEEENWEFIHGVVPAQGPDNQTLVRNGLIMCGTMSGCFDPLMGFGISGALISGRIAALAVLDMEKAQEEFGRFTRNFARVFRFKQEVWYPLRKRVDILEEVARILGRERSLALLITALRLGRKNSAIPGFSPLSCS